MGEGERIPHDDRGKWLRHQRWDDGSAFPRKVIKSAFWTSVASKYGELKEETSWTRNLYGRRLIN